MTLASGATRQLWRGLAAHPQLAIAASAALLFLLAFRPLSDPDIWFYLTQGREIVAAGRLPATESYIFPAQGEPAVYSAIGFGVFYFLVQQAGGYLGMAVVNALLAALSIALVLLAAQRGSSARQFGTGYVLAGLAAYFLIEFRFVYRPENLLFVFLGLELLLLESWLLQRRHRLLLALPPLVGLLALFHTSAALLLLVFAAYLLQYAWETWRGGHRVPPRERAALALVVGLLALVPLVNPNGWEQFLVILRSLVALDHQLVEYLPALATEYRWHFLATAALAVLALALAPRRRPVDFLLLAVFGGVAFLFVRNIGLFALMTTLPLARACARLEGRYPPMLAAAAAALGIFAVGWTLATQRWGTGIDRPSVMQNAVEQIRRAGLPGGNLMNFFHHGGYLAWQLGPQYKVAIDGHFVRPTFASEYHDRVLRADPDWEALLERYGVRLIVSPVTLPYSGDFVPLITELARRPDWQLVSVEAAGVLLARTDLGGRFPALPKAEIWRQATRELDELLRYYPDNAGARQNRALAQQQAAFAAR